MKKDHGSLSISYGNTTPLLKGSTLSYSCSPGLVLVGPNTATCMENGEWEPDPREVNCTSEVNTE